MLFSDALLHKKTKKRRLSVSPVKPGFNSLRACVCVFVCVYKRVVSAQRKNEERKATEETEEAHTHTHTKKKMSNSKISSFFLSKNSSLV